MVTEWLPRGGARSRETPLAQWRDELRKFWGKKWTQAARDRRSVGEFFILLWTWLMMETAV